VRIQFVLSSLLVLLLLPFAQAQSPSGVAIDPTEAAGTVSLDTPASFQFTVTHTGGLPEPFGQPRVFHVSVAAAPAGWTVGQPEPATFTLAPGASQTVTVQVAVSADAGRSAELTVLAQMAPMGVSSIPEIGPIADPAAEAEATLSVTRSDSVARGLIERIGPGPWVAVLLLAILAILVLAIKLAVDRRSQAIRLDAPQKEILMGPGARAQVRILVENASKKEDTVVFHVSEPDQGWAAFLPVPEVKVRGDHVEELLLTLIAPKDAQPGMRQAIQVQAAGSSSRGKAASLTIEAVIGPRK
jgi:hypothetical protein